ncbi:MAG: hypothetical protein MJ245_03790 [Clostridia bacterium]|nr:hypothetical protein [Clostridia bacterium]
MKKFSLLLCLSLSLLLVGCSNNEVKDDVYEENAVKEEFKNSSEVCYMNTEFKDNELLKVVRTIPVSVEEQKDCDFYIKQEFKDNLKRFGNTNSASLILIPRENSAYEIYRTDMNENFEIEVIDDVLVDKTTNPIIFDLDEFEFDTHIAIKVYDENDDLKTTWFVSESGMDGHLVMPKEEGIVVDLTPYLY